jgi:hypothetical protein
MQQSMKIIWQPEALGSGGTGKKLANFGEQSIARRALRRQALLAMPLLGSGPRSARFSLRVTKVSQVFSEKSL